MKLTAANSLGFSMESRDHGSTHRFVNLGERGGVDMTRVLTFLVFYSVATILRAQ